jgi:hypothetical protein
MHRSNCLPFYAPDVPQWSAAIEAATAVAEEMRWETDGGHLFRPHSDDDVIAQANTLPPFALYAREDLLMFALAFEFARAIEAAVREWREELGEDAAYELKHALRIMRCMEHRFEELERGRIVLRSPLAYHSTL